MKFLLLTSLFLLTAGSAQAAIKQIDLSLYDSVAVGVEDKLCLYKAEVLLGTSESIKPFQVMVKDTDGSLFLRQPPEKILISSAGQYYFVAGYTKHIENSASCPESEPIFLVK